MLVYQRVSCTRCYRSTIGIHRSTLAMAKWGWFTMVHLSVTSLSSRHCSLQKTLGRIDAQSIETFGNSCSSFFEYLWILKLKGSARITNCLPPFLIISAFYPREYFDKPRTVYHFFPKTLKDRVSTLQKQLAGRMMTDRTHNISQPFQSQTGHWAALKFFGGTQSMKVVQYKLIWGTIFQVMCEVGIRYEVELMVEVHKNPS